MSIKGIRKGSLSCQKWSKRGKGLDLETEPTLIKFCWVPPGGGGLTRILSRFVFVSLVQRNQVETARLTPALRKCVIIAKIGWRFSYRWRLGWGFTESSIILRSIFSRCKGLVSFHVAACIYGQLFCYFRTFGNKDRYRKKTSRAKKIIEWIFTLSYHISVSPANRLLSVLSRLSTLLTQTRKSS